MQSIFDFIIKPKNKRYNNTKQIGDSELLLNSEISDHRYISRSGIVLGLPKAEKTNIKIGDEVIVHHNVFRRWYDVRGIEKNGRAYYKEDKYFVRPDQIFLYKQNNKWIAPDGYCFVKPIVSNNILSNDKEVPYKGIVKHISENLDGIKIEDLVGFKPGSEYEFIVDGERLYRILSKFITIKYERQGNEKEYNPSWAKGS